MNSQRILGSMALVLTLFAVTTAVTLAKGSANVSLSEPAILNNVELDRGSYKVEWNTQSPEATVTFFKKGEAMVTATGRVEERNDKARHDTVLYRVSPDGSRLITEIRFSGKRQVIVFGR